MLADAGEAGAGSIGKAVEPPPCSSRNARTPDGGRADGRQTANSAASGRLTINVNLQPDALILGCGTGSSVVPMRAVRPGRHSGGARASTLKPYTL